MTERSAAEILLAQCDLEVAEAKADFARLDRPVADSLEVLIEKVCLRWWVRRMSRREPESKDKEAMTERAMNRAQILAACVQRIVERSGPIDPASIQMSTLGISADVNALWGVLIEAGMITPAMRQDYLDEAINDVFRRVEEQAQRIIVAGNTSARPS